jgi:Flp pilus assembly protein TadD
MARKYDLKKMLSLVLFLSSFLFFLTGCSSLGNMLNWTKFWDSSNSQGGSLSEKDLAQFASNMRPAQGNPDSHYLLACYYQERGRHKEAIEEFKKVISIDPNNIKAYNGMGVSYDLMGDFPRAMESYQKALDLNPNVSFVQNNLGYSYILQGNLDEAITAFQKAVALNDQESRVHNNLGLAYAMKDQYDLAMTEFKIAGDEDKAYFNIAQLYYRKGLYEEAKSNYAKVLTLDPSFTLAQNGLAAAEALARISPSSPETREAEIVLTLDRPDFVNQQVTAGNQDRTVIVVAGQQNRAVERNFMKGLGIEISNGNGVERMARKMANYLRQNGIKVVRLTNADNFRYLKTRVYYLKGNSEAACHVAYQIPGSPDVEMVKTFDRPNIRIKVLVGKDLIPYQKSFPGSYRQS